MLQFMHIIHKDPSIAGLITEASIYERLKESLFNVFHLHKSLQKVRSKQTIQNSFLWEYCSQGMSRKQMNKNLSKARLGGACLSKADLLSHVFASLCDIHGSV